MGPLKISTFVVIVLSLVVSYDAAPSWGWDDGENKGVCSGEMMPCDNNQCIQRTKWCDGEKDCTDGTDENFCKSSSFWKNDPNSCKDIHFLCSTGICIPKIARCDDHEDCKDGSDEKGCNKGDEDSSEEKDDDKIENIEDETDEEDTNAGGTKLKVTTYGGSSDPQDNNVAPPELPLPVHHPPPFPNHEIRSHHPTTPCHNVQPQCNLSHASNTNVQVPHYHSCPIIHNLCAQLQLLCSSTLSPWPCPYNQLSYQNNNYPCTQPCTQTQVPGVNTPCYPPGVVQCANTQQPGSLAPLPCMPHQPQAPCPYANDEKTPAPCSTPAPAPCSTPAPAPCSTSTPAPTTRSTPTSTHSPTPPRIFRPTKPTLKPTTLSSSTTPVTSTARSLPPIPPTTKPPCSNPSPTPCPNAPQCPNRPSSKCPNSPPSQCPNSPPNQCPNSPPNQCPHSPPTQCPNSPPSQCPNSPPTEFPNPPCTHCPNGPCGPNPPSPCHPNIPQDPENPCGEPQNPCDPPKIAPCHPLGPCSHVKDRKFNFPDIDYMEYQFIYHDYLERAKDWLLRTRSEYYGWGDETPRGLILLSLMDQRLFSDFESADNEHMKKTLQVKLANELHGPLEVTKEKKAQYLNAMLATNQNPRDFNGMDFVKILRDKVEFDVDNNKLINPFISLSLCLAGATEESHKYPFYAMEWLVPASTEHRYQDMLSFAIMTLVCYANDPNTQGKYLNEIDEATERLLDRMDKDGGFGNKYSTALAAQALLSVNTYGNWNARRTLDLLASHQVEDGSFGNLMATYFIVPALSGKSLLHLLNTVCEDKVEVVTDPPTTTTTKEPERFNDIRLSLYIGDKAESVSTMEMTIPTRTNLLEVMRMAEDSNSSYRFRYDVISGNVLIYSISGIPNDAERHIYWNLYIENIPRDARKFLISDEQLITIGGIEKIFPEDGAHVIFHYKRI